MVVLILIAVVVVAISLLVFYARWNFGVLEAMGIPVIKPHFLLGSTYNCHKEITTDIDIARLKKYGPVYGVYEGREPQIHICDPELIKCITVKDFENFNAKRAYDFGSPLLNEMPDFLQDPAKWKLVRQLTSPTLTAAKLKASSSIMKESVGEMINNLKEKVKDNGDKPLDIDMRQTVYTNLTDMILRSFFNVKIENQNDGSNYFVRIVKRMIEGDGEEDSFKWGIFLPLSLSFPFLQRFGRPLFSPKASDDFVRTFQVMLDNRRKSGRSQKDYTETILSWLDRLDTPEFKKVGITELTIMCQALVLFFAGEDQISQISSKVFLESARNPEIQKKIWAELDAFLKKHNGEIEYENLNELTYINACLNEALRLIPVFHRIERVCTKDWESPDGTLKIKKGQIIIMPVWATNRNPKYFPDPEKFDPERFMPENKDKFNQYAFISFGHGPRNCIGMRYAYDTLLLITSNIFRDFQFECNEKSKEEYPKGNLFFALCQPFSVNISRKSVE